MSLRRVIGASGVGLLVVGLASFRGDDRSSLPYYVDATLTPAWTIDSRSTHEIGDWSLVDQQGAHVSSADVAGKISVASFFFTTCRGYCPTLRSNLAKVASAFRGDSSVVLLSHTVTPEIDDATKLAAYARINDIRAPQWRLLTGEREQIARLARESYFVELSDTTSNAAGTLLHTETFVLVDRDRHIRGVYDGTSAYDVGKLIDDIRVLLRETSGRPRARSSASISKSASASSKGIGGRIFTTL
jgi:protein SCO1/2